MFSEITHEIAGLIRGHSAAILTGSFTILGTIFGAGVNFVLERIKQGGKVTFASLCVRWNLMAKSGENAPPNAYGERTKDLVVHFIQCEFRVLNTYPIPKTVAFEDIELLKSVPSRWRRVKGVSLSPMYLAVGERRETLQTNNDLQCDAHSFTRLWITLHGRSADSSDGNKMALEAGAVRAFRFKFLISPKRHIYVVLPITMENAQNVARSKPS
jgi:hypothetical protein